MPLRRFVAVPLLAVLVISPGGDGRLLSREIFLQAADDPCAAAVAQAARNGSLRATDRQLAKDDGYGSDTREVADLLVPSSLARRARPLAVTPRATASRDVDDIAIIEDDGTLILQPNPFDLGGRGLRFEPSAQGYDVTSGEPSFRPVAGRAISLGDDDAAAENLPFTFPYFGRRYSEIFVNSDGNLTFDEADTASTARGFARLLNGAPRIAPFFADLDPSAGGQVFVESAADAFAVTWCGVPGFDSPRSITMQVVLRPQGAVDVRFHGGSDLAEGIVALSPGRTTTFTPVELTQAERQTGGAGAPR